MVSPTLPSWHVNSNRDLMATTAPTMVPGATQESRPPHLPVGRYEVRRGDNKVLLTGELRMEHAGEIWRELRREVRQCRSEHLDLDLEHVTFVDGAVMSLLVELRAELANQGVASEIVGVSERFQPLVHLYRGDAPPAAAIVLERTNWIAQVGGATRQRIQGVSRTVVFIGDLFAALGGVLRRPSTGNWRAVVRLAEQAGADGVPIVVMLNFLVGFVMGFQSAKQLELYGANVYVADVVGISVVRELAPLITAIIVAGRSGASFAAELGTMRVTEEIDALRTLGFAPTRYLILPRVAALMLVTPILTLLGDVAGVAGGAVVASTSLDVSLRGYMAELRTAVFTSDVLTGLFKSVAFGMVIAVIGCQQGFATSGGAAGVGRRTTATVVLCLFGIVVLDTVFTSFFRMLRL